MKRFRTFASAILALALVLVSIPFSVCAETAEETQKGAFLPEDCGRIAIVYPDTVKAIGDNEILYYVCAEVDSGSKYLKLSDVIYTHYAITENGVEYVSDTAVAYEYRDKETLESILLAEFAHIPCKYEINENGEYTFIAFDNISSNMTDLNSKDEILYFDYFSSTNVQTTGMGSYTIGTHNVRCDENTVFLFYHWDKNTNKTIYTKYGIDNLPDINSDISRAYLLYTDDPEGDVEKLCYIRARADGVFEKYIEREKYTISYDTCGAESWYGEDQIKEEGRSITLSESTPSKTDYKFLGWATKPEGEPIYQPGDIYSEDAPLTLYAVWTEYIKVQKVTIDRSEQKLYVGEFTVINATILPENATNKSLTWVSSDTSIAQVDENGKVTGISEGYAEIYAESPDRKNRRARCDVYVSRPKIEYSGAQIRLFGKRGLRYVFRMDRSLYDTLYKPATSSDKGLGFGAVVMPERYMVSNELCKETSVIKGGKRYDAKVVPAVNLLKIDENDVYYTVCITGISENNYKEKYAAVPYITLPDENGNDATYYGHMVKSSSLFEIAEIMMEDETVSLNNKSLVDSKILKGTRNETFLITATEHYGYECEPSFDKEYVYGTHYSPTGKVLDSYERKSLKELGLSGFSDDYFLAEIKLSVEKASAEGEKDVILSASTGYTKDTLICMDEPKVIPCVIDKEDKEYYVDGDKAENVMSGLLDFGDMSAYLAEDAVPEGSLPLGYRAEDTVISFFDMTSCICGDNGIKGFIYTKNPVDFSGMANKLSDSGAYDGISKAFMNAFPAIYHRGKYEIDIYDSDGNGYADHAFVKPYCFARVLDGKDFNGLETQKDNFLSYDAFGAEGCTLEGVSYADKDFVLAYVNGNAEYVKIAEVIKPEKAYVSRWSQKGNYDGFTSFEIGFNTGNTVEVAKIKNKIYNLDENTFTKIPLGIDFDMYIKDDLLLHCQDIEREINALLLPASEDGSMFITTSAVIDGEYEEKTFVKVVSDGKVSFVDFWDFIGYNDDFSEFGYIPLTNENLKAHAYTPMHIGKNLIQLRYKTGLECLSEDDECKALEKFDSLSITTLGNGTYTAGNISFTVDPKTQITVKTYNEDEEECFGSYTIDSLLGKELENVTVMLENDTSSNTEKLIYLYAEMK